jgi:DNA topoisomerase-1
VPKPLVIVESPAKARTIAGFLGDDFNVESSVGHIRDLPSKGLSIDVDNHFTPTYEVHASKKDVIRRLKALLKDADELYLATDEDREGEAISWHLLQVLQPKIPVKRMVFHEITRGAITEAVENWRNIDEGLVDAQETRRIVDRLFGYPVSEVLWRKVNAGLSAGRVQSPAVRLIVERERERIAFRSADYWDLDAAFPTDPAFTATSVEIDGKRLATGKDFDDSGTLTKDLVVLDEVGAHGLKDALGGSSYAVRSVEEKPFSSKPKPPFMTSTLQQEGGRKLRMSSAQVMRVAQDLYQNGYITYMRTDSTTLSETALNAARSQARQLYGPEYVPDSPRTYDRKVKNAQEAHEAIRPAGETFRTPDSLRGELRQDQLRLYELIWKRTIASQMVDARGQSVSVRIGATASDGRDVLFGASGRSITFPGYLRAYVEGADDPDAALDDRETLLPVLAVGDALPRPELDAKGHTTSPPARFTEASLVKRLEELGIGRPSTYASIMQTIQDRGYVWKKGSALVPTWTAFAVIKLLEEHFSDVVDYAFTARMEDELDEIAGGRVQREPWLNRFWFGDAAGEQTADMADVSPGSPGLKTLVERGKEVIDPAEINVVAEFVTPDGERIVAKPGKFGPYLKRGEDTASIPDDLTPDELDIFKAMELLDAPSGDRVLGEDPESGKDIYVKAGRYGPYVQVGEMPEGTGKTGKVKPEDKPKTASLFKTMTVERITIEDALQLLSLPREVGIDPADGGVIKAMNGRYGPYLTKELVDDEGKAKSDTRSLENEEQIFDVTVEQAQRLFAEPKRRRGQSAAGPLRELGVDPVSDKPMVIKDGRFGPYVTDGETNASLRKGDEVETLTDDRASELLQMRREAGPSKKKAAKKKAAAKKAPAKKKAAAKKAPAKKAAGAKKAAAKRAANEEPPLDEPPLVDEPPEAREHFDDEPPF